MLSHLDSIEDKQFFSTIPALEYDEQAQSYDVTGY
jgi:hypothetical protein